MDPGVPIYTQIGNNSIVLSGILELPLTSTSARIVRSTEPIIWINIWYNTVYNFNMDYHIGHIDPLSGGGIISKWSY